MLPRVNRLVSRKAFPQIYRRGRRLISQHLQIYFRAPAAAESPLPKFGFVIAKKHAAKIAERNRIKRILRAAAREFAKAEKSIEIIVQGRPGIARVPASEIREEFTQMLKSIFQ